MIRKILSILFILIVGILNAQDSIPEGIKTGTTIKFSNKTVFEGVLGEYDESVFGISIEYSSRKPLEIFLEQLDKKDYSLTKTIQLNEDKHLVKGDVQPEKVILIEDNVLYFETIDDAKKNIRYLYLRNLNLENNTIDQKIIDTIKNYKSMNDVFYIFESDDEKQFCVVKTLPFENNKNQMVLIQIFNKQGDKLWTDQIELPNQQRNYRFTDVKYDGIDKVYLLAKESSEQVRGFSQTEYLINNTYNVWAYDHDKRSIKEFEIKIKDKWINDLKINFDLERKLHITGYYSNDRVFSVAGTFHLVINSSFQLESQKLNGFKYIEKPFPNEVTESGELKDVYLRNVLVNQKGGVYIIGESYYKEITEYFDPRTNVTTYSDNYYYGNIWISYYNQFGESVFTQKIPKNQMSVNDDGYFLSLTSGLINDELNIFYNDNIKNANLSLSNSEDLKNFQNPRKAVFTSVKVSEEGELQKTITWEMPDKKIFVPQNSEMINKKSIYFVVEKGREVMLMKYQP